MFTGSLTEGLQGVAQYSAEANTTMSTLTSLTQQAKNALGTAFYQVIKALSPVIQMLVQAIINASNTIAEFFAAVNGDATFTKAVYQWQDYTEGVNGATKANKAFVASFDELTVYSSGSSSGAAVSALDSFTTANVNAEKMQPLVDKFKQVRDYCSQAWELITNIKTPADFTKLLSFLGEGVIEVSKAIYFDITDWVFTAANLPSDSKDDTWTQAITRSLIGGATAGLMGAAALTFMGVSPIGAIKFGLGLALAITAIDLFNEATSIGTLGQNKVLKTLLIGAIGTIFGGILFKSILTKLGATSATALGLTFALALSIGTIALAITATQIDDSTTTGKLTKMLLEVLATLLGGVSLAMFLGTIPGIPKATAFSVSMGLALVISAVFLRNTANSITLDTAGNFLSSLVLNALSAAMGGAGLTLLLKSAAKVTGSAALASNALPIGFGIALVITGLAMALSATKRRHSERMGLVSIINRWN